MVLPYNSRQESESTSIVDSWDSVTDLLNRKILLIIDVWDDKSNFQNISEYLMAVSIISWLDFLNLDDHSSDDGQSFLLEAFDKILKQSDAVIIDTGIARLIDYWYLHVLKHQIVIELLVIAEHVRSGHDIADDGLDQLWNGLWGVDLSEDGVTVLLDSYVVEFGLLSWVDRVLELFTGLVVGKGSERLEVSNNDRG